jgi:hypothetical protein
MTTYTIQGAMGNGQLIHKEGCRDTTRAALLGDQVWNVEADTMKGIVNDSYGPEAGSFYEECGYIPGTPEFDNAWRDYVHDFRVMPCVKHKIPLD